MAKLLVETLAGDYDARRVRGRLRQGRRGAGDRPSSRAARSRPPERAEEVHRRGRRPARGPAALRRRGQDLARRVACPGPGRGRGTRSRRRRPPPRRRRRRRRQPKEDGREEDQPTKKAAAKKATLEPHPGWSGVEGRAGGGPGPGLLQLRGDGEQGGLVVRPPHQLYGGRQTVGRRSRPAPTRPGGRSRSTAPCRRSSASRGARPARCPRRPGRRPPGAGARRSG